MNDVTLIDHELTTETIAMAWKQCYAAVADTMLFDNLKVRERYDIDLLAHLFTAVYTYLAKDELLATYPASWWQALKLRWYPKRLLRRFPVQYTEIHAEHMFPQVPAPLGKHEGVRMYRTDTRGFEAQERQYGINKT